METPPKWVGDSMGRMSGCILDYNVTAGNDVARVVRHFYRLTIKLTKPKIKAI